MLGMRNTAEALFSHNRSYSKYKRYGKYIITKDEFMVCTLLIKLGLTIKKVC